jgi:hypothetical protein
VRKIISYFQNFITKFHFSEMNLDGGVIFPPFFGITICVGLGLGSILVVIYNLVFISSHLCYSKLYIRKRLHDGGCCIIVWLLYFHLLYFEKVNDVSIINHLLIMCRSFGVNP